MKYHEFMFVCKIVGVKFGYNREKHVVHVTIFVKFTPLCSMFQPYCPSSGMNYMIFKTQNPYIFWICGILQIVQVVVIVVIIVLVTTLVQGIDNYMREINHVSGLYSVAAALYL